MASRRRKNRRTEQSLVALIERVLSEPIIVTENGRRQKVTTLEAILRRLAIKELAGKNRAARVRLRFTRFITRGARKHPQLIFEDSDYTRALAKNQMSEADK